jgi:hypothetical protein
MVNSRIVMESKLCSCRIISLVCTIQTDIRLSQLLAHYKRVRQGMLNDSEHDGSELQFNVSIGSIASIFSHSKLGAMTDEVTLKKAVVVPSERIDSAMKTFQRGNTLLNLTSKLFQEEEESDMSVFVAAGCDMYNRAVINRLIDLTNCKHEHIWPQHLMGAHLCSSQPAAAKVDISLPIPQHSKHTHTTICTVLAGS